MRILDHDHRTLAVDGGVLRNHPHDTGRAYFFVGPQLGKQESQCPIGQVLRIRRPDDVDWLGQADNHSLDRAHHGRPIIAVLPKEYDRVGFGITKCRLQLPQALPSW
ncbi:hypothetical protein GCM10009715_38360 [Paeniglutamicibacter psychrophenolicus]